MAPPASFTDEGGEEYFGAADEPNLGGAATFGASAAPQYRDWADTAATRAAMYTNAQNALEGHEVTNATHRLRLSNVRVTPKRFRARDEKNAIGKMGTMHHPITADVDLSDINGQPLGKKSVVVGYIPHLTNRGTFVVNGTSYVAFNQTRLRPGVYHRKTANGEVEAQFNVDPRTGQGFRLGMDPATGVFKLKVGQSEARLYPALRALGVDDETLAQTWGPELLAANQTADSKAESDLKRVFAKFKVDPALDHDAAKQQFVEKIRSTGLDPEVMSFTQGRPVDKVDNEVLLAATRRMLAINHNVDDGDDRDSMAFQSVHGIEDYIAERLKKDAGGSLRKALWAASNSGNLDKIKDGFMRDTVYSVFNGAGLVHALEDINPAEISDLRRKLTRLGEGGLSDTRASPREARGVQPSHLGIIDAVKVPENASIGLDLRAALGTFKGKDNRVYVTAYPREAALLPPEQRKTTVVPASALLRAPLGFPGEIDKNGRVRAMVNGKIKYVDRNAVGFWIPHPESMFTASSNLVPLIGNTKAQRVSMGARMVAQALPLEAGEAPLVQPGTPDDTTRSYYHQFGEEAGALRSKIGGRVVDVSPDGIKVVGPNGEVEEHDIYDNLPMNRKTGLTQTPVVKIGDVVQPGGLVAKSNFTDANGALAVGRNARVGYMAYDGLIFEDAAVISESMAKKMRSQHLYQHTREKGGDTHPVNRDEFMSLFPSTFDKRQAELLDDNGVAKVGSRITRGDPLFLHVTKRDPKGVSAISNKEKGRFIDASEVWEHDDPGVVTDVFKRGGSTTVLVATTRGMMQGDKLSGRHGDKHVVAKIVPDDDMPHTADGLPLDVIVSPTGLASRINPSQLIEAAYGKIAAKTGKPMIVRGFNKTDAVKDAIKALRDAGLSDTEDLVDPINGRTIPKVFVGNRYYMRLHHIAEDKLSAREIDAYTSDDTPAKGGFSGSKRIAGLETLSLLSHGAVDFLRDAKLVRGQRNDDYWRGVRLGLNPSAPTSSVATEKFFNQLRGAGINVDRRNDDIYISPLTNAGVDALAQGREITTADTLDWDTMEPQKGGLFDVGATGGVDGKQWSYFKLPVPVPNPIAEESVRRILGMTEPKFRAVMSGTADINGIRGPEAVLKALQGLDARIDAEIGDAKDQIKRTSGAGRDAAVKRLGFLTGLKHMEVKPSDLMITRVPILPPKFRPISQAGSTTLVADPNYLYAEMISAADNFNRAKESLGDTEAGQGVLNLYDTVKAVTGLGDPVGRSLREKNVKGILKSAIGLGRSPKMGAFQRRVIGGAVDTVGRGVIVPDPKLGIDDIGVPERMAWQEFKPYVVRKLVQRGMPAMQAATAALNETPEARGVLIEVMKERPVLYTRAPALHRFSLVGGHGHLVDGDAIKLPLAVEKGLGADHDGDAINIHVPATQNAIDEIENKLLPSRNLLSPATFEAHMIPDTDIAHGVWLAGTRKSKRTPRTFKDEESAIAAYMRGELGATDPIHIARSAG
jgi:DNA-directed RNA polymerase beta subunit